MFVKTRKLAIAVTAGAMATGLLVSAALAGPIEDRQKSMKEQGAALGVLVKMLKNEAPFDAAQVKAVSDTLIAHFQSDKTLFPEGSDKGDVETWAKAEIWSDNADFLKRFDDAIVDATALGTVTDLAALGPALGKLGKEDCGACHEKFRRPKN
jgi:cytochrome c556